MTRQMDALDPRTIPLQRKSSAAMAVTLTPVPKFPMVRPGNDLAALIIAALDASNQRLQDNGDVLVVAQKIVSKAEGRYVDLAQVAPVPRAPRLARGDREGRAARRGDPAGIAARGAASAGVMIVEHRLGYVMANAGVDRSNIDPAAGAEPVLLLPRDPDASAAGLRAARARFGGPRWASSSATVSAARGAAARSASRSARPACRRSSICAAAPISTAAVAGQRDGVRRRDRRRRLAADGAGGRGRSRRCWCAGSRGGARDAACDSSAPRPRICSAEGGAARRRVVGRHRRRQARARPSRGSRPAG